MTESSDAHRKLEALRSLLLADIDAKSDEELRAEFIEDGKNPEKMANAVRNEMRAAMQMTREPTDDELLALWRLASDTPTIKPPDFAVKMLRAARVWQPAKNPENYKTLYTPAQVAAIQALERIKK